MCGIAGVYGSVAKEIDKSKINYCFHLMRRRGPDSKGLYIDDNLLLLNTRLKIIDLDDRANLPFETNQSVFGYNGELYNYKELKKDIEGLTTNSDTEVFIKLLEKDLQNLDKVEGMFAFALYSKKKRELVLCRDRFGEKPLYIYTDEENNVYFGSEIKFIQALLPYRLKINYDQIYRFLINGYRSLYKDVTSTFFKGVEAIRPGWGRILNKHKQEDFIYWNNKKKYIQDESLNISEIVEETRRLLIDSVEKRLRADIPIAFCQSGGVDSNSLISIAKKNFDYDVHGFTVVGKDGRYDEFDIVKQVVKELNIRHTSVYLDSGNFIKNLRNVIKYHDSPISTISYYIHWLLERSISESGYNVSISGTAGDELFSGYYDHYHHYFNSVDKQYKKREFKNWIAKVLPTVRNPVLQDFVFFEQNPYFREYLYDSERYKDNILIDWKEEFSEQIFSSDILRNRMLNELFHEVVPVVLHEDDLNSMCFSVENRSPFLDTDLFNFVNTIPTKYLIEDGYGKSILRKAMVGIVPDIVLESRRKVGFNAAIEELFDINKNYNWLFRDSKVWDIFDKELVEGLFSNRGIDNADSKFLFNLINVKLFLEEFE